MNRQGLQVSAAVANTDAGVDISDWLLSRFSHLAPRTIAERLGL